MESWPSAETCSIFSFNAYLFRVKIVGSQRTSERLLGIDKIDLSVKTKSLMLFQAMISSVCGRHDEVIENRAVLHAIRAEETGGTYLTFRNTVRQKRNRRTIAKVD